MTRIRVGILFGGQSAEHEVSLQSAKNIIEAIDKTQYEPVLIGIGKNGEWHLSDSSEFLLHSENPKLIKLNKTGKHVALIPQSQGDILNISEQPKLEKSIDVIFPVLHGPLGEDGTVQGLLKLAGIPFVGAGVAGSAVGMDKDIMKRLLRDAGIPVSQFMVLHEYQEIPDYQDILSELGSPFFVKPANLGSSVGIRKVNIESEYRDAVAEAFKYDLKIILEENIEGREIECAVLGNENPEASVPGEVIPLTGFYSYDAKYIDENSAALEIPAKMDLDTTHRIQALAVKTFQVLSCEGMGRVDVFLKSDGTLMVNEINTIPGFTSISMYPRLWDESGLPYPELIHRLIQLALMRHEKEKKLQ